MRRACPCYLKHKRFILLLFVSPQAFRKLDEMSGKLTEQLRKLAKQVGRCFVFYAALVILSSQAQAKVVGCG